MEKAISAGAEERRPSSDTCAQRPPAIETPAEKTRKKARVRAQIHIRNRASPAGIFRGEDFRTRERQHSGNSGRANRTCSPGMCPYGGGGSRLCREIRWIRFLRAGRAKLSRYFNREEAGGGGLDTFFREVRVILKGDSDLV